MLRASWRSGSPGAAALAHAPTLRQPPLPRLRCPCRPSLFAIRSRPSPASVPSVLTLFSQLRLSAAFSPTSRSLLVPSGALRVEGAIPGSPVAVKSLRSADCGLDLAGLRRVTSRDSLDEFAAPPFFSQGTGQGRISATSVQCLGVESQGGGLKLWGACDGEGTRLLIWLQPFDPAWDTSVCIYQLLHCYFTPYPTS